MSGFERLKTRNDQRSTFNDGFLPTNFSRSPGVSTSVTKANEGQRLVRCKHCGWICDRERDIRAEDQSFAGIGVHYGDLQRTDGYLGDGSGMITLNTIDDTIVTVASTTTITKTTDRSKLFYSIDGYDGADGRPPLTDTSAFNDVLEGQNSIYQLMHNKVIKSIHAAVDVAPGIGSEIQFVVCVDDATTDMRAVIAGTATYAVSAALELSTGSYAPVKVQVNYDDAPTTPGMMAFTMVVEGSGEQTYHGPSYQYFNNNALWGLHGAYSGISIGNYGFKAYFQHQPMVQSGVFSNLRARTQFSVASTSANISSLKLVKSNGTGTWNSLAGISITPGLGETTFSSGSTYSASTGDYISFFMSNNAAGTNFPNYAMASIDFTPNTPKHFNYGGGGSNIVPAPSAGVTQRKTPIVGVGQVPVSQNDTEPFIVIPAPATIKGFLYEINDVPDSTTEFLSTLRKNYTDTSATVIINSSNSIGTGYTIGTRVGSTSTQVDVIAGDKLGIITSTVGTGTSIGGADGAWAMTLVPSNDNEYYIFYGSIVPTGIPVSVSTTETYTTVVSVGTTTPAVGDAYSLRDVRSGCPSCGSYLYDGDEPFQEVKFDV